MGCWGTGTFENDHAADWAWSLEENDGLAVVELSGKHLKQRTGYTFSFVVACIACINVPIGTILGVFTLIVLARPAVKAAFGKA